MRTTAVFSVVCKCGVTVEWADKSDAAKCSQCGRALLVAAWPNHPLVTVEPEARQ